MIEEVSNYLNEIRHEFAKAKLEEGSVSNDPIAQYAAWFEEAVGAQVLDPKAMVLSTVGPDHRPSARVVYARGLKKDSLLFYTNYQSRKGKEIAANPAASITIFWPELERQIRMEGAVAMLPEAESDAYFASRPRESQIGAWASDQSDPVASREVLEQRVKEIEARFHDQDVPRPPHWGGYAFTPDRYEFWQGRPGRLHDRIVYERSEAGDDWQRYRVCP